MNVCLCITYLPISKRERNRLWINRITITKKQETTTNYYLTQVNNMFPNYSYDHEMWPVIRLECQQDLHYSPLISPFWRKSMSGVDPGVITLMYLLKRNPLESGHNMSPIKNCQLEHKSLFSNSSLSSKTVASSRKKFVAHLITTTGSRPCTDHCPLTPPNDRFAINCIRLPLIDK